LNWLELGGERAAPVWPLEDVLAAAAATGFAAVGLDDASVAGRSDDEVAELLRMHGLACTDVGVLRIGVDDAAERLASLAAATGARSCIAAVFDGDAAAASLRAAADVLDAAGVRIALEHAAYGALRTLDDAVALCEDVGWDRCGLLLDSWHLERGGGDAWELVAGLDRTQVELVHLNDAPPPLGDDLVRESRERRLPPGRGELDLDRFLEALDRLGYDGVVSLEVLSAELRRRTPLAGARELFAAARALRSPLRSLEMN
jgi:sugar phosphate isomerase/epimerase